MDPAFKLLVENITLPFIYCIVAGIPPVIVGWMMNKAAGRPAYNGYKISRWLGLAAGAAVIYMTIKKDHMDYPFWQPSIGVFLAYLFWSSRIPLMERSKEAWLDEQRIYQGRKDRLGL
ncbi:MAG: hypothetical protein AMXMBFR33_43150 [Candidatus Xenobia bacterium]